MKFQGFDVPIRDVQLVELELLSIQRTVSVNRSEDEKSRCIKEVCL